jgi:hypothetical protein
MIAGISSHAWKQSGLCRVHPATKWHVSSKQNLKKLPENGGNGGKMVEITWKWWKFLNIGNGGEIE